MTNPEDDPEARFLVNGVEVGRCGFPLKVESIEVTLGYEIYETPWIYIGPEETPPKHRKRWEWFRTRVLRRPPHWRLEDFRDISKMAAYNTVEEFKQVLGEKVDE